MLEPNECCGGSSGSGGGAGAAGASNVPSALLHRYDFEGEGTWVRDRGVGAAHGEVMGGAALSGDGVVLLDGSDDFISLPSGLISGLQNATLLAWVRWNSGRCWERVFDFGSRTTRNGPVEGENTLFLAARSCGASVLAGAVEVGWPVDRYEVAGTAPMPTDASVMVGLVINAATQSFALVLDGAVIAESPLPVPLSSIDDVYSWLGRSLYAQDRFFDGQFEEFRVYSTVLSAAELAAIHEQGADQL